MASIGDKASSKAGTSAAGTSAAGPSAAGPSAEGTFVSKDTLRRIVSDIKELNKNPLTSHGIYYEHDEVDVLKGRALIIGPADTPYADGFYFFKFEFPANYPHAPPKVEFYTGDGVTRFNPNLYRTGKVCLSILNTWKGEQWSGCQTISSVLLAICTVLNDEPLLNEPGITKAHRDYEPYNEIIKYKNIEVAIFGMLKSVSAPKENERSSEFAIFGDIMRKYFLENKEKIRQRVQTAAGQQAAACKALEYSINVYKMTVSTDYNELLKRFD
jgi:ubiquitin-conjugating enzyme E2 Z